MKTKSKVQIIERKGATSQAITTIPAGIAGSLGLVKGEDLTWEVEDRYTLRVLRDSRVDRQSTIRKKREAARVQDLGSTGGD